MTTIISSLVTKLAFTVCFTAYIILGNAVAFSTPNSADSSSVAQRSMGSSKTAIGISTAELSAFVDGIVVSALGDHKIAGATVAVVSADEVLHLQGYGYANAPERLKVDATEHLFRIASITKTFTATAVMQLVEVGKLDLANDIKDYLPEMPIDDHLGSITVAHLLTHTPGFEDRFLAYYGPPMEGEGETLAEQLASLGAYQVRPPGEIVSYSNFGFSLLGEIIARASGQPYADYLREHILDPLQMKSSDVRVKTTPDSASTEWLKDLRKREAKAHRWSQGWYEVTDFPLSRSTVQAEGTMSATAADMANYMQMHLNRGRWNKEVILEEHTWTTMSEILFTHDVELAGNAHGFWTDNFSGYRVLQHGGSINDFKSMLALIPELGLGVFVSGNTDSSSALSDIPKLLVEYLSRKTSAQAVNEGPKEGDRNQANTEAASTLSFRPPEPAADFQARASLYTGHYLSSRRNEKRYDRLLYTLSGGLEVSATSSGYLVLSRGQNSTRYVEVEAGEHRFVSVDDGRKIKFRVHGDKVAWLFTGGTGAYEPAEFLEKPLTFLGPLISAIFGATVCLLIGAWGAWKRWQLREGAIGRVSPAVWVAMSASLFWLLSLLFAAQALKPFTDGPTRLYQPFPTPAFQLHLLVLYTGLALTVMMGFFLVSVWRDDRWTLLRKVAFSSLFFTFSILALVSYSWNLLGTA
ncbi:MAG: serine hydrolase domain-containing protein [Pseudomonadota bacterium]